MEGFRNILGTWRRGWAVCLGLFFFALSSGAAADDNPVLGPSHLYLRADTLKLDVQIDSLFSRRALDAINSGMSTSIIAEFRLNSGRKSGILEHMLAMRLEHDIWEGQYLVIRNTSSPESLRTTDFKKVTRFCSNLKDISLGLLAPTAEELILQARIAVNPISPEQERRTRSWLNFLNNGSILELFISLDRPTERTRWLEVARFRFGDLR